MALIQRVRYGELQWPMIVLALAMTLFGLLFVVSATMDPEASYGWGREARMQLVWWGIAVLGCVACMHVPLATWRALALPALVGCVALQAFMIVAAGTALVPTIKGAHNWIALGQLRVQPSEFYKLAALLAAARLLVQHEVDVRSFHWCTVVLIVGCLPAALIVKEDLGSALTFLPLVAGLLVFAGMPVRFLAAYGGALAATLAGAVALLPESSYQIRRLRAWLDPQAFAREEGYQTIHALRAIGSGQVTGKGYAAGDQNLLGWLPEQHTDMVFAVIAEELGFLGAALVPVLFCLFGWAGMYAAVRCRDEFGRLVIAGFTCLVVGQAAINLFVVLALMPVTGITLPFFSYGGSSLLATWCGLGICMSAVVARNKELGRTRYI